MTSNLKHNIAGTVAAFALLAGGFTVEKFNTILQTILLVIGIVTGSITLYNILRHRDTHKLTEDVGALRGRVDEVLDATKELPHKTAAIIRKKPGK